MTLQNHPEQQYLDLLRTLITAPERPDRTGTGTRGIFGHTMTFDLAEGFPLLTTKKVFWRGVVTELLWFLSGSTNARVLEDAGINIWREWGDPVTREMGPIYGRQMRHWLGLVEDGYGCIEDATLIDQVANVLQGLRGDPYGRRHVMTLWNPADLSQMALPPCHGIAIQLYVAADGRLDLFMHQRSADVFLGVPFNIASYALLLSMFAAVLGRLPGRFIWSGGDVHLYANHIDQAREQIGRRPRPFPTLVVDAAGYRDNLDGWTPQDLMLFDYDPHPAIAAEVAV